MQLRTTLGFFVLAAASAALAQNPAPSAPSAPQAPAAGSGPVMVGPVAPSTPFPPIDPANFTATSPTRETVEEFLKAYWGYDSNRIWQVQAILPTPAQGVARVLILVKSTAGAPKDQQTSQLSF